MEHSLVDTISKTHFNHFLWQGHANLLDLVDPTLICKTANLWTGFSLKHCNRYVEILSLATTMLSSFDNHVEWLMWKDAINGIQWTYLFLLGIRDKLYYFTCPEQQEWLFSWCQDSIHRILYLQSCDTVKYLSDPNEGVILYVLPDFRQQWRLVCRNMMRGNKSTELAVLLFFCKGTLCPSKWVINQLFIGTLFIFELNQTKCPTTLPNIQSFRLNIKPAPSLFYSWHCWTNFLSCYIQSIHLVRLKSTRLKAAVTGR